MIFTLFQETMSGYAVDSRVVGETQRHGFIFHLQWQPCTWVGSLGALHYQGLGEKVPLLSELGESGVPGLG